MPYSGLNDLPKNVKNVLPEHAQTIYKEAFNDVWCKYQDAEKRRGNKSREQVSRQIAWAAVKKKYQKSASGEWVKR